MCSVHRKFSGTAKKTLFCCLAVFLLLGCVVLSVSADTDVAYFDGSVPSYSWHKNMLNNDEHLQIDPPNILFLIDSSGSMTFDQKNKYTYGDGSKRWWYEDKDAWQYYWGRDTLSGNNTDGLSNYHPLLKTTSEGVRMPNDSRLYILRNVMYQLLQKKELMAGVNIAIGTYYQKDELERGDWYREPSSGSGTKQYIQWNGSSKGMRLRVPLQSAIDPSTGEVRVEFTRLFDGVVSSPNATPRNEEIRADGGTPLAASIYPDNKWQSRPSAYDFFKDNSGNYDGICQANWVIMMTDGSDTASNRDPHDAVKRLYDNTDNLKDKAGDTLVYPVRTMAIGFINSGDMVSLRKELDKCADVGFDGEYDGEPAHAYYADNFDDLFAAFEQILTTIKEMSGRESPPAVSPGLPGIQGDVYVPGRVYREKALWEGSLEKHLINYDGTMLEEVEWEASFPSDRKVLTANWHGTGTPSSQTNLANFNESHWSDVVQELGIRYALSANGLIEDDDPDIETETKCFIKWYRGEQPSCTNWAKRESPLADMDRSGMVIIGPPRGLWGHDKYLSFKENYSEREERLYIQSSEGMLHSFNTEDGEEQWAFIPPQALRWARIAGLKAERVLDEGESSFWKWNWYGNNSDKKEEAYAREILGGPLVVEDIFLQNALSERFATVLLGCMGYGGYGMYALEISDPEKPRFLWAVENARAVKPVEGQENVFLPPDLSGSVNQEYPLEALLYWREDGTDNTLPTADFENCALKEGVFANSTKTYESEHAEDPSCTNSAITSRNTDKYKYLGFTLGEPYVGRAYIDPDDSTPLFLGFMGAGLKENLDTGDENLGCALYAFSMEDGSVHAAWGKGIADEYSVAENYLGVNVPGMGMVYAPVSPLASSEGKIKEVFAPDSLGNIHNVILYDASAENTFLALEDWKHRIPAVLSTDSAVAIPFRMPVGAIGNAQWIFGGTKDVLTPSGRLQNATQYILGIKISAFCGEGEICGINCTEDPITMENLKVLDAADAEDSLNVDTSACGYEEGSGGIKYWGWQIPLLEADSDSPEGEYVSAAPQLSDMFGRLFVATYEPYKEGYGADEDNPCEASQNGMGRFYILNGVSGASDWPEETEKKYVEFPGLRVTGLSVYDVFEPDEDGNMVPGTRVVLTLMGTKEGQEKLQEGGETRGTLEDAGATDINAETEGMLSFFVPLPDERAAEMKLIDFDATTLLFWKKTVSGDTSN